MFPDIKTWIEEKGPAADRKYHMTQDWPTEEVEGDDDDGEGRRVLAYADMSVGYRMKVLLCTGVCRLAAVGASGSRYGSLCCKYLVICCSHVSHIVCYVYTCV